MPQPYTDADIRAEAARQHALSLDDPDFMGIGERMNDTEIPSFTTEDEPGLVEGTTWDALSREDFDAAQRAIDDLLAGAADVSRWAVDLGADGLEPVDGQLTADTGDGPLFRIHIAVRPDMPEDVRTALLEGLGMEIAKYL
ncbi:hypothetical protein [Streptomyces sp. Z26]|uniref:hypothetical protein n=1 Tax=Streptomyces sp. Z26 TaxID=2500177 RepID=UPI001F0C1352|nr:hypothetical protein [Streptomyces sp. Z26]